MPPHDSRAGRGIALRGRLGRRHPRRDRRCRARRAGRRRAGRVLQRGWSRDVRAGRRHARRRRVRGGLPGRGRGRQARRAAGRVRPEGAERGRARARRGGQDPGGPPRQRRARARRRDARRAGPSRESRVSRDGLFRDGSLRTHPSRPLCARAGEQKRAAQVGALGHPRVRRTNDESGPRVRRRNFGRVRLEPGRDA